MSQISVSWILISVLQILLALALFAIPFYWAPWIACKSLEGLSRYDVELSSVPEGAGCFYISHGTIGYLNHLPISENPSPFVALTILLLLLYGLLMFTVFSNSNKKTV